MTQPSLEEIVAKIEGFLKHSRETESVHCAVPCDMLDAVLASWRKQREALKESREWLDSALGLIRGEGPPNWDGIRLHLKAIDAALND